MIERVIRGGAFYCNWFRGGGTHTKSVALAFLRICHREGEVPEDRDWFSGFRLVVRGQA